MTHRTALPIALLVLGASLGGCHAAAAKPGESPAASEEPCDANSGHALEDWRVVHTSTFTACFPADWKAEGGNTWRKGSAMITWGPGHHGAEREGTPERLPSIIAGQDPKREGTTRGNETHHFGEMLDGRWADLWRNRVGGTYYTGIEWGERRFWLAGQASDARLADEQLDIFRTVHFVTP